MVLLSPANVLIGFASELFSGLSAPKLTKWDERFLQLATTVAGWSKDPSTKVGAVIADDKHVVSLGFNGFPPSTEDKKEWLNDRPTKYSLVIHAEVNAILNARRPVNGLTLYVAPLSPCAECAKLIAASGIRRVVSHRVDDRDLALRHALDKAKDIFAINGITFQEY